MTPRRIRIWQSNHCANGFSGNIQFVCRLHVNNYSKRRIFRAILFFRCWLYLHFGLIFICIFLFLFLFSVCHYHFHNFCIFSPAFFFVDAVVVIVAIIFVGIRFRVLQRLVTPSAKQIHSLLMLNVIDRKIINKIVHRNTPNPTNIWTIMSKNEEREKNVRRNASNFARFNSAEYLQKYKSSGIRKKWNGFFSIWWKGWKAQPTICNNQLKMLS